MKRLAFAAALMLAVPSAAWCASTALDALLQSLARPAPATTQFTEIRFSKLLSRPLIVSGELEYLGPDALVRTVREPFQERTEIHGENVSVQREGQKPRHFSLRRAPELRGLLGGFAALLGADRHALEAQFDLDLQGDQHAWRLVLTPRDARIRRHVSSLTVDGRDAQPRCLTSVEPDGDATVLLLAQAAADAKLPPAPSRSTLEAWCRGPHDRA